MPLKEHQGFNYADIPARGSTRAVFHYIDDAVTNNGWQATPIDKSDIATHMGIDRTTVNRGVKSLRKCAAIKIANHGRCSTYLILKPPRTATTSSKKVATAAVSSTRSVLGHAQRRLGASGTGSVNPKIH